MKKKESKFIKGYPYCPKCKDALKEEGRIITKVGRFLGIDESIKLMYCINNKCPRVGLLTNLAWYKD